MKVKYLDDLLKLAEDDYKVVVQFVSKTGELVHVELKSGFVSKEDKLIILKVNG